MNHRKTEHPSTRTCRYYLNDECRFDAELCWYKHVKSSIPEETLEYSCNDCDKRFQHKMELMKHRKTDHLSRVFKCRDFSQGKCNLAAISCWYVHDEHVEKRFNSDSGMNFENEKNIQNQDFHKYMEKTPPDQMSKIMNLINQLSLQVEMLEKKSEK